MLIRLHGPDSVLARAVGSDTKAKLSLLFYAAAIPTAFVAPRLSLAVYALVAVAWLVPDRRIERTLTAK